MLRFVEEKDIDSWVSLAGEVEDLFGPMVGERAFVDGLHSCVREKSAICIEGEKNETVGFAAFSREKKTIEWLAVKRDQRGKGYGKELVGQLLKELCNEGPLYVRTFSSETDEGALARKLYAQYGFVDYKSAGKNPAGIDTVIMIRM